MRKFLIIFAIFVTILAIGDSQEVKWLKNQDSPQQVAQTVPKTTPPKTIAATLSQDPALLEDAQELGIQDYTKVNINYAQTVTADDATTDANRTVIGSFTAPNTILIQSGLTKRVELQTVAYEYMHYLWIQIPQASRDAMIPIFQQFYDTNSDFHSETSGYYGSAATIADERDATACTKIPPYELVTAFNDYCNTLITNRSILFQ